MTEKKLEDRIRACREIDAEVTMKNMADFFGAMATPVDFNIEGESNTVLAESLLDQIEDAYRQISEARIKEIREVLKVLSPGVEQDVLDRITDRSLILVPAHDQGKAVIRTKSGHYHAHSPDEFEFSKEPEGYRV